jgi:putative peptidoglycan lipid II flippase
MVLAAFYGAGTETDAFIISFTITTILMGAIASSVATIYIPQYQRLEADRNKFTSNIISILIITGFSFAIIFTFIPQALVFLFASQLDSGTFTLASSFLRITLWAAVPILLTEIFLAFMQINSVFFKAQITLLCRNAFLITSITIAALTNQILIIPAGVITGEIIVVILLITLSRKKGFRYYPHINIKDNHFREMLRLMAPLLIAVSISELNLIIDRNFASSLASGSISALNYSSKVRNLFMTLIGVSIVTVMYPKLSALTAENDIIKIKSHIKNYINKLFPLLLPLTIGMVILSRPLIMILFERGAFTPEDTQVTLECLSMYAVGIIFVNINPFLIKIFHAIRDTKTPALISAASVVVSVMLNIILIGPLKHMGLALSTSIAAAVMMGMLLYYIRKKFGPLGFTNQKTEWLKTLAAAGGMGIAVGMGYYYLPVISGGTIQTIGFTSALIIGGMGIYFLLHLILKTVFIDDFIQTAKSLLKSF